MDQNQTVDNDLQKAIDDITNTTNADPVFSDPVAAPSSVPEGDTGQLSSPVGPFPEPAKVDIVPPAPEPIAPLQSMDIPELEMPIPEPLPPAPTPVAEQPEYVPAPQATGDTAEIKKAALRDLAPLLDKVNMDTTKKFGIYKDILNDLKDYSVLDSASRTAREIPDETERAEALLYIVESIDNM